MNTNKLQRIFKVVGIAFSLIFAIGIFSTESQAQRRSRDNNRNDDYQYRRDNRDNDRYDDRNNDRYDDRYRNNRRNRNNDYNQIYRESVQHGYNDGIKQGIEDARNGRRPNAQRAVNRRIRQAGGSNPSPTVNYYREGFIRGYNEGYQRYDNNDRDYNYNY